MILVLNEYSLVMMAERSHPFPYRTRKLSSSADGSWDLVPVREDVARQNGGLAQLGEHLPYKQGSAVRSRHPPPYVGG